MKHPFWVINDLLLLTLIVSIIFMLLFRPAIPPIVPLETPTVRPPKQVISKIDLSKIYTNDLFNTYKTPALPPPKLSEEKAIPQPPTPKLPPIPPKPPLKFLEPLKIQLRGIMTTADERFNTAIIQIREGATKNYKIGDMIEDAQLIRILKNKIILIRSNGQQETLFVTQRDAELEQLLMPEDNWDLSIKKDGDYVYFIDPVNLTKRVRSLAQFINMLNLTTVYRQGESIGCRIGKLEKNSLGIALGLIPGDIIESINEIPTTNTNSRFKIYKNIISMNPGEAIVVSLKRKNQPITMHYNLELFNTTTSLVQTSSVKGIATTPFLKKPNEEIEAEKRKILEQKYRFAPTAEELQKSEKEAMLKMSQRKLRNNQNPLTNVIN